MQTSTLPLAIAGAVIAIIVTAAPTRAQNDHSWVSSTGSGAACTRTAPCNSIGAAHNVTNPGGVVSVLDSGDFGGFNVTKSLTIRAEGVDGGNVSVGGFGFGWISVIAGASDVVQLEGLHFAGGSIRFDGGGQLHVRNCVFRNNLAAGTIASVSGILFRPNGPGKLVVTDTAVINNGSGATGAGILIQPQAGGSARVHLERVSAQGGVFGIVADGTGSTAGINMTVADSVATNNTQDGILAVTPAGGAPIGVMIKNTRSTNNTIGIRSIGPNVTVRASNSTVIGNGTGLAFTGGGALLTFGNNEIQANGANGAFSGSVGLQ